MLGRAFFLFPELKVSILKKKLAEILGNVNEFERFKLDHLEWFEMDTDRE